MERERRHGRRFAGLPRAVEQLMMPPHPRPLTRGGERGGLQERALPRIGRKSLRMKDDAGIEQQSQRDIGFHTFDRTISRGANSKSVAGFFRKFSPSTAACG
jgi:hypothetical protein